MGLELLCGVVCTDHAQKAGIGAGIIGQSTIIVCNIVIREKICRRAGDETIGGRVIKANIARIALRRLDFAQLDACVGFDEAVEGIGGEATVRIAVLQNLIINGAHLVVEHVRHLTHLLQLMHRIGARRADLQICVDGEN